MKVQIVQMKRRFHRETPKLCTRVRVTVQLKYVTQSRDHVVFTSPIV